MEREKNLAAFLAGNHADVPKTLLHVTDQDVKSFSADNGIAAWAAGKEFADDFARSKFSYWKAVHLPWEKQPAPPNRGGKPWLNYMPVHISAKKPFDARKLIPDLSEELTDINQVNAVAKKLNIDPKEIFNSINKMVTDSMGNQTPRKLLAADILNNQTVLNKLREMGHDSLIAHEFDKPVFAVFDPSQIKSAIGNQGTYDPNTTDITKAEGGSVETMSNYIPHNDPRRAQNLEAFDPIKDENGKPRVFYHNTNRDFSTFHTNKSEFGAHFGTPNHAAHLQANQENPLAGRRTMAVHLNIKNPLRMIDKGDFSPERVAEQLYDMGLITEKKYDRHMEGRFQSEEAAFKDLQKVLKDNGHDGVVYLNRREGLKSEEDPELDKKKRFWHFAASTRATDDEFKEVFPEAEDSYIAFSPNQIKSATGNRGTFDVGSPDITKAEGGSVDNDGIDVLHSSPHDFDKFKLSKIGTGEGNQMYGHGLYFAQNPAVSGQGGDYWRQFWNKMKSSPEQSAATALHASKFDRDAAIQYLISSQEYHTQHGTPGKYAYDADIEQGHRELADKYRQAAEILKAGQIAGPRTYEVKIKAHPDHFLDWDRPISEQSEHVRNVINKLAAEDEKKYGYGGGLHYYTEDPDSHSGESVYQYLKGQHEAPHASKILSKMGIKGIKYFDAMSRNPSPAFDTDYIERQIRKNREEAKTANEDDRYYLDQDHEDLLERLEDAKKEKHITRNFVVFDPKHLEIKKKYASGGSVMADGGSVHEPHERARDQGYVLRGYHVTRSPMANAISSAKRFTWEHSQNPGEEAVFFWTNPKAANDWAHLNAGVTDFDPATMNEQQMDRASRHRTAVLPVRIHPGRHMIVDWPSFAGTASYNNSSMSKLLNQAKAAGYDTLRIKGMNETGMGDPDNPHDQIAVLNPRLIRSEYAKFDPTRMHEDDIGAATGGVVTG